jgi:hypothetical protein
MLSRKQVEAMTDETLRAAMKKCDPAKNKKEWCLFVAERKKRGRWFDIDCLMAGGSLELNLETGEQIWRDSNGLKRDPDGDDKPQRRKSNKRI